METQFNSNQPSVLHIDFNSCFASIEQQANPLLRGKPTVVAAYATPRGCILAASREAKLLGIKTGKLVYEGRELCPNLVVLEPDPSKYRTMHHRLEKILRSYSPQVEPKSIDEFVVHFDSFPTLPNLLQTALDIKKRIQLELGEWLTVSIGIGPNRFLAKQAAIFKKPDGLEIINHTNFLDYYSKLKLTDLNGIASANALRLNNYSIYSVLDLYNADLHILKRAFGGIVGYYWFLRLRGWEVDNVAYTRRMYGAMYSLPKAVSSYQQALPILTKLVEKSSRRMAKAGFSARSISIYFLTKTSSWHQPLTLKEPLYEEFSILSLAKLLAKKYSYSQSIIKICFSLFNLQKTQGLQISLFDKTLKNYDLSLAMSSIKEKYGEYGLILGSLMGTTTYAKDAIGFGNIKDMDQFLAED